MSDASLDGNRGEEPSKLQPARGGNQLKTATRADLLLAWRKATADSLRE
jgi:hypothetical protein